MFLELYQNGMWKDDELVWLVFQLVCLKEKILTLIIFMEDLKG